MSSAVAPPDKSPWHPVWITAFVVVVSAAVTFAVAVGFWLTDLRTPRVVETVPAGQWLDKPEHGFRIRLDGMELRDEVPGGDANPPTRAIPGAKLLLVTFTVMPTTDDLDQVMCLVNIRDDRGQLLTDTVWNPGGPQTSGCTYLGDEPIGKGDTFQGVLLQNVNVHDIADIHVDVQVVGQPRQQFRISG